MKQEKDKKNTNPTRETMAENSLKRCQLCGNSFEIKDLYPLALIRNKVIILAEKKYPNLTREGFVCLPDLQKLSALRFEEILKHEKGKLTEVEKEVLQSFKKNKILSENINEEFDDNLSFGERISDKIAQFGGSWYFISLFGLVILIWMSINSFQLFKVSFDPFPYILLNLVLSCLAAVQAPIILMSQNRQALKDRLSQENNYQINLKSELYIRQLDSRLENYTRQHWMKMEESTDIMQKILKELSPGRCEINSKKN